MSYLLQVRNRGSRVLLDHWETLRCDGGVPLQTQIRPRALKEILPQVFIVEATDPRCPIYRLAGTGLCERFGRELRGVPFLADWEVQSQRSVVTIMRTAQTRQLPACFHTVASLEDFGWVDVETVLAPLASAEAGVVRFVGTMQITSDLPRLNRGIIVSQRLVTSQVARVGETQEMPSEQEPPPPAMQQVACRSPQPHWLKVVLSVDRPGTA